MASITNAFANAANLGTPQLNQPTDTKDKDTHINTLHQGMPSEQTVKDDQAKAKKYREGLSHQIATHVDVLDSPPKAVAAKPQRESPNAVAAKPQHPSPNTQRQMAADDRASYNNSVANDNYLAASLKRKNRRARGVKKVQSSTGKTHFHADEPLTVTHGDAWETASMHGKKSIATHRNKSRSDPATNADSAWAPGKKQSSLTACNALQSTMNTVLDHVTDSKGATDQPSSKISPQSRKNFKQANTHTLDSADDQFQAQKNTGKRQHLTVGTFKSSMKGAAAHANVPDLWMTKGDRAGKKQHLKKKDHLVGSTADVPAAKVQKLRIHLVQNSQRNASNLGVGMLVRKSDGVHNAKEMKERERPQKKHTHNNQMDHMKGARLSIHQSYAKQGLKQVNGAPSNHSQFVAPGVSDVDPRPVSPRKQLKSVPGRNEANGNFQAATMALKKGATKNAKRQLSSREGGATMYTTTKQIDVVRGVRKCGPSRGSTLSGGTFSHSKSNVGRREKPAAGFSKSMGRSRGVGHQKCPPKRTAGGNSQIVFG